MRQERDDEEWEGNVWLGGVVPPLDAGVRAREAKGVLSAFSEGPC
jgi:hypothetical protein